MVNQWLCFLFQGTPGVVLGLAMDSMQPLRKNAPPKWVRVLPWALVALTSACNIFGWNPTPGVNFLTFASCFGSILICYFFFYKTSFLRQAVITAMLILAVCSAELLGGITQWVLGMDRLSYDFTQPDMVIVIAIGSFCSNLCLFFAAVLWRRFRLDKRMPRGSAAFVVMPLCLFAPTAIYCLDVVRTGNGIAPLPMLSMAGALLLDLLLIFVQFNQAEKEEAEKALEELKQTQARQKQQYESMEERWEEMAKLRHDYNNHLSSVLGLIRMGNRKEAEAAVKALLQKAEYSPEDRKMERDT